MPQFEQLDTFISQGFWLVVFFALFYVLLAWVVSPRLRDAVDGRSSRVASDLARADEQQKEAEACSARRMEALDTARSEARVAAERSDRQLQQDAERRLAAASERLEKDVTKAETDIAKQAAGEQGALDAALAELAAQGVARLTGKALATDEKRLIARAD